MISLLSGIKTGVVLARTASNDIKNTVNSLLKLVILTGGQALNLFLNYIIYYALEHARIYLSKS